MHAFLTSPADDHDIDARSTAPMRPPAAVHVECDSVGLFKGTAEVRIRHLGQEYRLRQTRNGKLILTK